MKYTRIFLFLSPLILLIPPLLPLGTNLAWSMLGMFYGTILRRFPWNLVMAGLCYAYAQQLGRDAFRWAGASFFFPFCTPLILGFMSPKYNSTADVIRRMTAPPPRAKGASGVFEERFPLLQRCLSGMPEATCAEQRARFTAVESNYEFSLPVSRSALDRMLAEAASRNFTVWTQAGDAETQVYGAGLMQPAGIDDVATWLRGTGASGGKLSIIWRQPDGMPKIFEYYSA
jgi:hypothetical protein